MPTLTTRLEIASWDEAPTSEHADGSKITRAAVTLAGGPDGLGGATSQSVMYYRPDGTSSYVDVMVVTADLDGRAGSFVLVGRGDYDGATATSTSQIVPGSGTGDLAGISGTCTSESTHADYPFMPLSLTYRLE
ncbi:MAG: DUF3224 domain-containing protein [Kineosporiaceae bacterium]|jgi:hypothetical protein